MLRSQQSQGYEGAAGLAHYCAARALQGRRVGRAFLTQSSQLATGSSVPGRCKDHGWLDVGDAADSDGLGETLDSDELDVGVGVGEVVGVGEWLMRGV